MTREELNAVIMSDRKKRNFYGHNIQNQNNNLVLSNGTKNNESKIQNVGVEQYNSAPINIPELGKVDDSAIQQMQINRNLFSGIQQEKTNDLLGNFQLKDNSNKSIQAWPTFKSMAYYSAPSGILETSKLENTLGTLPKKTSEKSGASHNRDYSQKLDIWLNPSYKLSREEEKEAKEYIKKYRSENNGFKIWLSGDKEKNPYNSKEGISELQRVAELEAKLSGGTAAWTGFTDTIPFLEDIQDKIGNTVGKSIGKALDSAFEDFTFDEGAYDTVMKEVMNKSREGLESSKMQNPLAAQAGNIAGEIGKYSVGTQLLAGAGLLGEGGKITQGVSKVIKNPKVAGSVANILGDTSVDVALDTIPQLMGDISKGEENAGTNALKNVANNLAFNTLGEGLGIVGGKALGMVADAYKKRFGKVDSLNTLEDYAKKADEFAKDSDDLQKQVLDSSQDLTTSVSKEKLFDDFTRKTGIKLEGSEEEKNKIIGFFKNKVKKYSAVEEKMPEISNFVDELIVNRGQTKYPHNQLKINKVPDDVAQMVSEASDGRINISEKYFAMEAGKMFHELEKHGNAAIEESRGQLPITSNDIKELAYTMIDPDLVQNISNGLKTEQRDVFALAKSVDGNGYIVIVEAVGGKRNPNIVPEQVLKLKESKMSKVLNGDVSIADLVYENSNRKGDIDGNVLDIKKRVTAAQLAQNAPVHTSETYQRSPLLNNSIPTLEESVNGIQKEMYQVGNVNNLPRTSETHPELISNNTIPSSSDNVNAGSGSILNREGLEFRKLDPKNNEKTILYDATEKKVKERVSKVRSNTLENSGINTAEELSNKYLNENNFKYTEKSEKETMQIAVNRLQENPQKWYKNLMASSAYTASDIDTMMMLYRQTVENARMTNDEELWKEAGKIYKKIQVAGTKGGQLIQSLSKWRNNTAEGIIAHVLTDTAMQLKKRFGDKKTQAIVDELTENIQKDIYELAEIAQRSGLDSKEGKEALAKMGKIINANTPKTISNVITTSLMDSMLLNFKTLISRNAGGNLGYNAMEFVRQPFTALIDRGVSKFTGKRTRTGWKADKMLSAAGGLGKGLKDEASDFFTGLHTSRSGESTIVSDNFAKEWGLKNNNPTLNAIEANAHAYKGKNLFNFALNKIDDLTKHALSIGDRPFYEAAYKQRYVELIDLRKKEWLDPELMKLSNDEFKNYAELAAKMDGLMATYQDDGPIAEALGKLKKGTGQFSEGALGGDILSQVVMPFTKTPGNIASRSLEYSPFGIIKNTFNTIGEVRKGEFNQQRFVDELGRNILGTGLFAGGIAAYDNGLMTGSYSDDKDMRNAQKNSGMQEFAWRTNKDGKEGNYEISWIPVLGNNLVMAAAAKEAYDKNKGEDVLKAIGAGASTSADALLNTSALQGMNRLFGGNASYSTENNLFDNALNALTSGFGQAVPSALRQVAQSTDEYERELSEGDRKYWQNSLISYIPELREQMLQPKIDNEGNLIQQNQGRSLGSRLLENMISPGKYTEINNSPVNAESMRLFESTGNNYSFLPTPKRDEIVKGNFTPNDAQFTRYRKLLGQRNSEVAGALIESNFYKLLSDENKEKMLQDVYEGMKAYTKLETVPGYTSDNKVAEYYRIGGVNGALKYLQMKYDFNTLEVNMSGKMAQEAYYKDGLGGLQDYAKYSKAVDSLGLTVNNKTQSLYEAGGIPYLKQYSTFKTKADYDRNGSLKKEEVVSYLDSTGLSRTEKRYWFSMLSTAKNPY